MNRNRFISGVFMLSVLLLLVVSCGSKEEKAAETDSAVSKPSFSYSDENPQIDHILQESEVMLKHYEDIAKNRPFTSDELKELSEVAQQISIQTDEVLKDPNLTTAQANQVAELHHRWMKVVHHNLSQRGSGPTAAMTFEKSTNE